MKALTFLLQSFVMMTPVLAMRRPLSSNTGKAPNRFEPSSSSSAAPPSSEYSLPQVTETIASSSGSEKDTSVQLKRPRQWQRVEAEKRLMTEVLPKLERWVQEAKEDKLGRSEEEVKLGAYGKPLIKPNGLLQLKEQLRMHLANTRRYKDPLFDNFINRVIELRDQLPIVTVPALPLEEARARKSATMKRYLTREKVKALGVDVKPNYLNKGGKRGYKQGEPGYEKYIERVRKGTERRRLKKLEAKKSITPNKRVGEVAESSIDASKRFTPLQSQAKEWEQLPNWSTKRRRTERLQQ